MTNNWVEMDQKYLMGTYAGKKLPLAISHGEGNYLYDTDGNEYLDLFTGLAVNVAGHSHPALLKTLMEQGERFLHISNVYVNIPAVKLAKRLSEETTLGKVFFANSGAEATEAAIKLIHKYKKEVKPDREGIVVMKSGFHGRTLGSLSLTMQPGVQQDFPVSPIKVIEVEPENIGQLEKAMEEKPLAIIFEPVLGSGGLVTLSPVYLNALGELASEHEVLVCTDEIQTGIGRTGRLFAYQYTHLNPDIILFAKGIGGGLPLSGIIAKPEWSDLFKSGDHGTTFAPSPLSCALGNTLMDLLLDEGLMMTGSETAAYFRRRLEQLKSQFTSVQEIRGRGMMFGILLDKSAGEVEALRKHFMENGILIDVTAGNIIRLLPPLTLARVEVDRFIDLLKDSLKDEG